MSSAAGAVSRTQAFRSMARRISWALGLMLVLLVTALVLEPFERWPAALALCLAWALGAFAVFRVWAFPAGQKRLEEHEDLLRRLSERVPGAIFQYRMYADGRSCFPYASEGIRSIYEVAPADVREDATPVFARLHPDDFDGVARSILESFTTMQPWRHEYRVVLPGRGLRWLRGESMPERLEDLSVLWHGCIVDVTDRREAEEALRASEERFRRLSELSSDWYWEQDAQLRFKEIGDAGRFPVLHARTAVGKTRWELEQTNLTPAQWAAHRAVLERHEPFVDFEFMRIAGDGLSRWVSVSGEPVFDAQGRFAGYRGVGKDITERKAADAELRASEERLRATLDNTPGVAVQWFDREGRVRYWNPASERLYGIPAAQAVGRTMLELLHTPAQFREFRALIRDIERSSTPVGPQEITIRSVAGTEATVMYTMFMLPGGAADPIFVCMDIDVTERKRAEEALRQSESRFRSVFEQAAVGMTLRALDGRWLAANDMFCSLLGYTLEELASGVEINVPEEIPVARAVRAQMVSGTLDHYAREKPYLRKDGSTVWVHFWASVIRDAEQRPVMRLSVVQDITARRRAEDEIRTLNAELERRVAERTAELAAANRELETFAYSVSHDLKAPLRGIDGYSQLLLEGYAPRLDDEGRRFLQNVREGARSMNELIEDLLAYARMERGGRTVEPVEVAPLLEALVAERRADPAAAGCSLVLSVPALRVTADREGLTVALRNLLDNAVKFTGRTPGARVEAGGREEGASCILWVRDNGPGFDMKYHDRIFGIFERLHRAEDYPGTGVGLAIVQKAMARMGGRVWAESIPGQGATFYLEIPRLSA